MEVRLARPRLGSPGGSIHGTGNLTATWRWESVCFLTALCFKASLLPTETNAGVAVPCIQNETEEKKTKRTPAPKPRKACRPFPRQNVQRKRRERLCGCCPDLKPRSAALSGAQLRGPAPQRHRGPKGGTGEACPAQRRSEPFSQPGPGPRRAGAPPG